LGFLPAELPKRMPADPQRVGAPIPEELSKALSKAPYQFIAPFPENGAMNERPLSDFFSLPKFLF
jgi:hypothetical protein